LLEDFLFLVNWKSKWGNDIILQPCCANFIASEEILLRGKSAATAAKNPTKMLMRIALLSRNAFLSIAITAAA
jgi:hypothetical protein